MATYIVLSKFTQQGVQNIKDSPKRLAADKRLAKSLGGRIRSFYMTMGSYDVVAVLELPDDDAAASVRAPDGAGGERQHRDAQSVSRGRLPEDHRQPAGVVVRIFSLLREMRSRGGKASRPGRPTGGRPAGIPLVHPLP